MAGALLNLLWLLGAVVFCIEHYRHTTAPAFAACHRTRDRPSAWPLSHTSWMWDRHFWGVIGTLGWPVLIWPYALLVRPRADSIAHEPVGDTSPVRPPGFATRVAAPATEPAPAAPSAATPEPQPEEAAASDASSGSDTTREQASAVTDVSASSEASPEAAPQAASTTPGAGAAAVAAAASPAAAGAVTAGQEITMRVAVALQLRAESLGGRDDGEPPRGISATLDLIRAIVRDDEREPLALAFGCECTGIARPFSPDLMRSTPDALLIYPEHVLLVFSPIRDGSASSLVKSMVGAALPGGKSKITPHWRYPTEVLRDVELRRRRDDDGDAAFSTADDRFLTFTAPERHIRFGIDLAVIKDDDLQRAVAQIGGTIEDARA